jgi:transcriptional regulator GlxA family with amidase domain
MPVAATNGRRRLTIDAVRALVDREYARPWPVPRLARLCGLTRAHFIRAFRAAAGETPHRYLRARRIDRARELLVTTPLPITEICQAVGFRSLGSFCSLFRRSTGDSPAAYRARRRRPVLIPDCFIRMYRVDPRRPPRTSPR